MGTTMLTTEAPLRRSLLDLQRAHADEIARRPDHRRAAPVATDYNAGLTSALVRLYQEYGGTPLTNFPTARRPDMPEMTVETDLVADPRETRVKATIYNKSAFPARALTTATYRYYFTRDDASTVVVTPGYTQACPSPSTAQQASGTLWYVEVDCTGYTIAPAGQSQHRMEVQFKVGVGEGGVGARATTRPTWLRR